MTKIRTYSELRRFDTFDERFEYLRLEGRVGHSTFGFDRWLNQAFYTSREWRDARHVVILRDRSCDLGLPRHEIFAGLIVHHMNPLTVEAVENGEEWLFDPEFLICASHRTHNAIHYGDASSLPRPYVERQPGDTSLW